MDSKYEALFTPWKIGNVEIKNRIVLCSMGGLTGCEIAHDLYLQGKKPTIIEMKHDLIVSDKICLPIPAICAISSMPIRFRGI